MLKTVLITGATSGIGYELSKLFAKNGYNLVLVARNKSNLDKAKEQFEKDFKITVLTFAKDLSAKNTPLEIYDELKNSKTEINILVNNAGFGTRGNFIDLPLEDELSEIELNISA